MLSPFDNVNRVKHIFLLSKINWNGYLMLLIIFVWRITWTEEPGWSIINSVVQSRTRVKRLSTHV